MKRSPFATVVALVLLGSLVWIGLRALRSEGPTLLAWTPGELPAGLAASVSRLSGVEAVAEVRNGTAWLSSWADGDAAAPSNPPAGFAVPVEVAAIDPDRYSAVIPSKERKLFQELSPGEAVLGRTGARLRGIDGTGSLQFAGTTLAVQGVVDDDLVASHEVVVTHQTGAVLGIDTPRYLLIALKSRTSSQSVEEQVRDLLPRGHRLKVRAYGEARVLRPGDPVLPHVRIKEKFGEFAAEPAKGSAIRIDSKWIVGNTVNTSIPLIGRVRCHKAIIPQMRSAFEEIVQRGLASKVSKGDFGGCFSPRRISSDPDSPISHHAWGIGFDINVSQNPYGRKPTLDHRIVEIFERWGFTWGGHWLVPDGMHFEYLEDPGAA